MGQQVLEIRYCPWFDSPDQNRVPNLSEGINWFMPWGDISYIPFFYRFNSFISEATTMKILRILFIQITPVLQGC